MTRRCLDKVMDPENFRLVVGILVLPVLDSAFWVLSGNTPFLLLFGVPLALFLAWAWIAMHGGERP